MAGRLILILWVLSPVRHSLMAGEVQWSVSCLMLVINAVGLLVALRWLNRNVHVPFLI